MPQSTIGRIEAGLVDPQVGTLTRLRHACGLDLEVMPRPDAGVDRTEICECLKVTPAERVACAGAEARVFEMLGKAQPQVESAEDA